MRVLRVFLTLLCLNLCKHLVVKAASGYLDILKVRGDQNGSVFDLELDVTSGIYKSGYESNVREIYRLHIVPYGSDKVYISAKQSESFLRNGDVVTDPDDLPVNISEQKLKDFILTSEGKIIVRKNDPENNWNFYKTIGNFLIFDYSVFENNRKEERSVFKSVLPTIYGSCNINSIGAMTGWDSFSVKQFFDPFGTDCENSTSKNVRVLSDVEGLTKPHGLKISNYREYNLLRKKESFILDSLITNQKIFWSPVEGKSLVHFLQTSYKFNFVEESALSVDDTDFDFESEKNLELVTSNPNEAENVVNLKSMENINSETLISCVRDRLKDISFIWEKSRISSTRHDQLVGRELTEIISVMELFKFQQFYDLWILLSNDTSVEASKELDIFYKIVPYIGTEECVLFIKKLIILKEVGNNLMEKMLTKLAGSIRQPTPKVAEALKEVWDSNKNVNAALLAYTSALGAGFRINPAVFHDLMEQAKKDLFTKISESSSNFNNQRLYYQALGNLNCISLADDNVIKLRSVMFNNDMLMHLILALEKSTDGQYVFDLMLKILRDVSKSSELKAVALRIALKRMPSYDQYETLARVMDEDTNYELYNLFESSVRAFVKVKELPESALLWLRNREPMSRSMAFAYESPEDYPLAFSVRGYLFFNDLTWGLQQIHFDVYQKYGDRKLKMYTIFVRLLNLKNLNSLSNIRENLIKQGTISYEFSLYRCNMLIMSFVDNVDIKKIHKYLKESVCEYALLPYITQMEEVFQHYNFDYFFPTDTGRNAHLYFHIPWMYSYYLESLKVEKMSASMNVLVSLNATAQSVTGLFLYHPKLQGLQGSWELSSVRFTDQIAFKMYSYIHNRYFNLFFELTDGLTSLHGIQFKKETTVHLHEVGDESGPLKKVEMLIQHADIDVIPYPISQDLILFHSDFGYKYHMQVFGYNAPPNNKEFPESLDEMMYKKPFSDVFKDSDEEFLVSLLSYINWNFLAHSAYSYNFKATIEPSDVFPITKYALSVGPSQEYLIEFKDKDDNVRVYYKLSTKRNIYSYIQLLRMGLGLKSSGICFGHIVDESDESMYHLTYGTDSGDLSECPMDQFSLSVKFKSDFSFEQIENHNNERLTYIECSHTSPYLQSKDPTNNHGCGKAASTFRNMDVKLSYENIPKKLMKYINQIWTWFLKTNNGNSLTNHVSIQSSTDITVKAFYPMTEPFLNLDVILSEQTYSFKLPPTLLTPDNLGISDFFYVSDFFFPAPYCVVVATENRLKSSRHYLHTDSSSWTEYANINLVKIYVKKVSKDKLALKIEYPKTEVTVYPKINSTSFEKYDITLGEKGIDLIPVNWAHRRTQSVTVLDTIFFVPEASKEENHFMIGYNGHSITIFGSYNADQNYGKCFGLQAVNIEGETDYETCDNFIKV